MISRKRQRLAGLGALELIEEAVHLLRLSPARVLCCYYAGSLPFVLGFFYFWADMSRSSTAFDRCAPAALGVGLLFLWMKTWQAIFARELKSQITARPQTRGVFSRFGRTALIQTTIQPTGLFLLPITLAIALPFGWVYAFYQNVTVLSDDDGADSKRVFRQAARQAQLWQRQNHVLLAVFFLFGLVVFLNTAIGVVAIPSLLKTLLGVETMFTRGGWSYLNTTFLAAVAGLAYLCFDPLIKTVYLLRCFYGESLRTGEDLKVELKQFTPVTRAAAVGVVLFMILTTTTTSSGAETSRNRPPTAGNVQSEISPVELDRAIEQVLNQREYSWRLPREKPAKNKSEKGFFSAFMDGLLETIKGWAQALLKGLKAAVRWTAETLIWLKEKLFGKGGPVSPEQSSVSGWMVPLQILVFVLLALVACSVAIFIWRVWKQRRRDKEAVSSAVVPTPDLTSENVVADQMPEDEWLTLALELMGRGELRLALRALYLASLAHLAHRQMISIARFKSNRDYERELDRRARALPELQTAFAENVSIFERVWYGMHEVTEEVLNHFQTNFERIKAW